MIDFFTGSVCIDTFNRVKHIDRKGCRAKKAFENILSTWFEKGKVGNFRVATQMNIREMIRWSPDNRSSIYQRVTCDLWTITIQSSKSAIKISSSNSIPFQFMISESIVQDFEALSQIYKLPMSLQGVNNAINIAVLVPSGLPVLDFFNQKYGTPYPTEDSRWRFYLQFQVSPSRNPEDPDKLILVLKNVKRAGRKQRKRQKNEFIK